MDFIIHILKEMALFFGKYGTWGLFLNAFTESFFITPPPDALLIMMDLAVPKEAIWYATVGTVASALGGIVGYFMGKFIGRPAFNWFFKVFKSKRADSKAEENFQKIEALYDQYGSWAVFFAAFTPIPYKLFTIASGILNMNSKNIKKKCNFKTNFLPLPFKENFKINKKQINRKEITLWLF